MSYSHFYTCGHQDSDWLLVLSSAVPIEHASTLQLARVSTITSLRVAAVAAAFAFYR